MRREIKMAKFFALVKNVSVLFVCYAPTTLSSLSHACFLQVHRVCVRVAEREHARLISNQSFACAVQLTESRMTLSLGRWRCTVCHADPSADPCGGGH